MVADNKACVLLTLRNPLRQHLTRLLAALAVLLAAVISLRLSEDADRRYLPGGCGPDSGLVLTPSADRSLPEISSHKTEKNHLPGMDQPRVSVFGRNHTLEVNSNTLGLCALHQPGAVCTKAANPETIASRCRRRVERTFRSILSAGSQIRLKYTFKDAEITYSLGGCRCYIS